jgi:spore coat protein H
MNNNLKLKRMTAIALIAVFLAVTVIYKIQATDKRNLATISDEMSAGDQGSKISKTIAEYESIFRKDSVIDIKIDISENDWKSILNDPLKEEYKSADVTVNGTTVKNVGFRAKGNLSLRSVANSNSDRFSFKIKVDEFKDGQKLLGLDEFVVNNMYADPSYMREYLSYEALREIGATVPDTVFANVYINGELYGFYLCIESVDDSFLKSNFGSNEGNLYRQDQGSTLQYSANSNYDKSSQKQGDDETKTDLKNFIKVLNEMPEGQKGDIEKVLDVDSALRYIAANTVLGNYDSYNGNLAQNYYLYGQNGKFTVIPWDYNMSIGGFSMGGGDQTAIPIDEPVLGVNIINLPLINNLLSVEEYKNKYHEYVKELLQYLEKFETRVTEVANIIRPYVEKDPTKFYTIEQFEESIKYSETNISILSNLSPGSNPSTDAATGASQEVSKNQTNQGNNQDGRQMMKGQHEGFPMGNNERPQRGINGNMQAPPIDKTEGNTQAPPQFGNDRNMKGGPGGAGGPGMSSGSVINYVRNRVENIKKQLSGELPTIGNTTMSNNMPEKGNRNKEK